MTGVSAVMIIVAVVATAAVCFGLGWWARSRTDAEVIEQLEAELGSRKEVLLEHERVPPPLIVSEDPASLAYWRSLDQADDTGWDLPAIQLEDLSETDIWVATLTASTDRFLLELGIEPVR